MTTGRVIARNSAWNIAGHAIPIAVAVVAIPPLMRGLGAERFGILTLAWAAIGYFSLFELGLSRALTHAIAQRLANSGASAPDSHNDGDLRTLTWTALLVLFGLGSIGALAVALSTPLLVERVLNVAAELRGETTTAFFILAVSLPFVVTSVGLRGVMEAHQHFGAVTLLRIPIVVVMFFGPLAVLPFSRSLVPAVGILAIGRVAAWAAHLAYCLWRYEFLRSGMTFSRAPLRPLLTFGGWTTVSSIVSPIMVVLDRFFIGAMLTMAAVAHYVTPYEGVTKLLVIPIAMLGAVFPAFAETYVNDRERMAWLYGRSLRAVVVLMFPVALVTVAFAREGLALWLGQILPRESTIVLQWLGLGVFLNSLAQPPYSALQGAGRPDLIAKLHLVELPLYLVALWILLHSFGLAGAAIAWVLRVGSDAIALLVIAWRRIGLPAVARPVAAIPVAVLLAALAVAATIGSLPGRVLYVSAALMTFLPWAWMAMLSPEERSGLRQGVRGRFGGLPAASKNASGEGIA